MLLVVELGVSMDVHRHRHQFFAGAIDSLGGGIGSNNRYTFDLVHALVDDMVLVTEAQIADAMAWLYWNERIVAEGAGAVGVAALLNGFAGGGRTVAIVSGCNVDMADFTEIVRERAP